MQHLDQKELAQRWRISPRTLERWRRKRSGPKFMKLGGRCIYSVEEVERFEEQHLREQTDSRAGDQNLPAVGEVDEQR